MIKNRTGFLDVKQDTRLKFYWGECAGNPDMRLLRVDYFILTRTYPHQSPRTTFEILSLLQLLFRFRHFRRLTQAKYTSFQPLTPSFHCLGSFYISNAAPVNMAFWKLAAGTPGANQNDASQLFVFAIIRFFGPLLLQTLRRSHSRCLSRQTCKAERPNPMPGTPPSLSSP